MRRGTRFGAEIFAGDMIPVKSKIVDLYREAVSVVYSKTKSVSGVTRVSKLEEKARDSYVVFVWHLDGYTRSDLEANAGVNFFINISGKLAGTVNVVVEGKRVDWGQVKDVLDSTYDVDIPSGDVLSALKRVFG